MHRTQLVIKNKILQQAKKYWIPSSNYYLHQTNICFDWKPNKPNHYKITVFKTNLIKMH